MNTRTQAGRRAFTLVELLVVIAIIGMLAGLLLPAVQRAREAGRTATCLNNMRNLTIGMQTYESRRKELPGYANVVAKSSSASIPDRLGNWVVMLLPQIERTNEYTSWTADPAGGTTPDAPYISLLVCPSNPPDTPNTPALSYVANCATRDFTSPWSAPPITQSAGNYAKAEKIANGVLFDRWSTESKDPSTGFSRFALSSDRIPDGSSSTLLLSENNQAGMWISGGPFTAGGSYNQNANDPRIAEQLTGFVWDKTPNPASSSPPAALGVNGDKDKTKAYTADMYIRPSSQHPAGVNVTTCGGETLFLNEGIDYGVYRRLMTSCDKKSDMPKDSSGNLIDPALSDDMWR